MDPRTLIELMKTPARLKDMTRHSWTRQGRHESVAEHTFSLALLAYFVKDEFPNLDIDRVIRIWARRSPGISPRLKRQMSMSGKKSAR